MQGLVPADALQGRHVVRHPFTQKFLVYVGSSLQRDRLYALVCNQMGSINTRHQGLEYAGGIPISK